MQLFGLAWERTAAFTLHGLKGLPGSRRAARTRPGVATPGLAWASKHALLNQAGIVQETPLVCDDPG